jgi:hypothetical protein
MEKINIVGHVSKSEGLLAGGKKGREQSKISVHSSHDALNCPAVPSDEPEIAVFNVEYWVTKINSNSIDWAVFDYLVVLKRNFRHQSECQRSLETSHSGILVSRRDKTSPNNLNS